MRDLGSRASGVGVRVPMPAPNKVDSFDTIGIETIDLILLPIILAEQGFSAFFVFGKVSLWVFSGLFSRFWTPIFVCPIFTLKLFLGEKFQRDRNSFIVRRKVSEWAKALR